MPTVDSYTWVMATKLAAPSPTASAVAVYRGMWWVEQRGAVAFARTDDDLWVPACSRDSVEALTLKPDGCTIKSFALLYVPLDMTPQEVSEQIILPR